MSDDASAAARPKERFAYRQTLHVASFAVVGLFFFALCAALDAAKTLILPLVSAIIIGTTLSRIAAILEARRVPRWLSAAGIVIATLALLALTIGLISAPLVDWATRLPELGALLRQKMSALDGVFGFVRQFYAAITGEDAQMPFKLPEVNWMQPTVAFVTPTLSEIALFFVFLYFFIVGWPTLRKSIVMSVESRDARLRALRIFGEIEGSLRTYLLIVSAVNAAIGMITVIICYVAGLPNPLGLGALAAVLNYIPMVGPLVMFAILALVGLVSFDTFFAATAAPIAFAAITFLEGNFITPAIIGRRMEMNAFAVILSLAFWTWLWGPMGAFLATPILIVMIATHTHTTASEEGCLPDDGE